MNVKHQVVFILLSITAVVATLLIYLPRSRSEKNTLKTKGHLHMIPAKSTTKINSTVYTQMNETVTSEWPSQYDISELEEILNLKGYSVSQIKNPLELWTSNIHLCINFNLAHMKPNPKVVELLILYYYPFFKDITIIFDRIYEKPDYVPDFVDYFGCNSNMGWYQQRCLRECMQRGNKDTVGHFYIADDMFINITKLSSLNVSELWFVYLAVDSFDNVVNHRNRWPWWGAPTNSANKLGAIIPQLPPEWKQKLVDFAGFPSKFKAFGTADIIYIPNSLAIELTNALDFISDHVKDLFCEVALPLAVNIAAPHRQRFVAGYLWTDKSLNEIKNVAKYAHFVHPVKLGVAEHADVWKGYMNQQLFNIFLR